MVNGLLQRNASKVAVSQILGISEDTLERRIREKFDCTFTEYKDRQFSQTILGAQQKAIDAMMEGGRKYNEKLHILFLKSFCGWNESGSVKDEKEEYRSPESLRENDESSSGSRKGAQSEDD